MKARQSCACLLAVFALAVPAAADELDDIKGRGQLLVGVTESSPPFSYRDAGKGIVGYDVDLADRVAENLGVAAEKIPIINAERIPALQQGRVEGVKQHSGGARNLPAEGAGEQGEEGGAEGAHHEGAGPLAAGVAAHAVGHDHEGQLVAFFEVGPDEVLDEQTVLVALAHPALGGSAADLQTKRARDGR